MLLPKNLAICIILIIFSLAERATMDTASLVQSAKICIPPLDNSLHKGQAGRIGVIGGSLEYTGAPYFAGISALKVGADLVHVFCASQAATVIKAYSPELIVHPLLDSPNAINDIKPWLDRLHVLVIGPGLGRNPDVFEVVSQIINVTKEKKIPLVIDADGLFLITENPKLISDYPAPGVILTPNKIEFERLYAKIKGNSEGSIDWNSIGKNVSILKKGAIDEFYSSHSELQWQSNNIDGSGRRCGGQGDLLSGSLATFLHWTLSNVDKITRSKQETNKSALASAITCYAGSILIKSCNKKAFAKKGRSMLASDMIDHIHESFEELFGQ